MNAAPCDSLRTPDLDWREVTETVRMLNLAVAQIALAMHEGEDSVESLTRTFTGTADSINEISAIASQWSNGQGVSAEGKAVLGQCSTVSGQIQHGIVAFQFYDRPSQRLEHVKTVLEQLSTLVADRSKLFNPEEWQLLQRVIREKYSMQEEQDRFDALQRGATIDEALEQVRKKLAKGDIDAIELFCLLT